jgi:hypothetical protein
MQKISLKKNTFNYNLSLFKKWRSFIGGSK